MLVGKSGAGGEPYVFDVEALFAPDPVELAAPLETPPEPALPARDPACESEEATPPPADRGAAQAEHPIEAPATPTVACFSCFSLRFWRLATEGEVWVCSACHPWPGRADEIEVHEVAEMGAAARSEPLSRPGSLSSLEEKR